MPRTLTLATRKLIEAGKDLAAGVLIGMVAAKVVPLALDYTQKYEEVHHWHRLRAVLPASDDPRLSARESEIVALVAAGHDTKTIATMLAVGTGTIKSHLTNARRKGKK